MKDVVIRGFSNSPSSQQYGKAIFSKATFNASVALNNPQLKYLLDFYPYLQWAPRARESFHHEILAKLAKTNAIDLDTALFSWVVHYDPMTKKKTSVDGFCVLEQSELDLYLSIVDSDRSINAEWTLPVGLCQNPGERKPVFVASNVELGNW